MVINIYKECDVISCFNGLEGVEVVVYKEGDVNLVDVVC